MKYNMMSNSVRNKETATELPAVETRVLLFPFGVTGVFAVCVCNQSGVLVRSSTYQLTIDKPMSVVK